MGERLVQISPYLKGGLTRDFVKRKIPTKNLCSYTTTRKLNLNFIPLFDTKNDNSSFDEEIKKLKFYSETSGITP